MNSRPIWAPLATAAICFLSFFVTVSAVEKTDLFDPERHIDLDQIHPGMHGTGKTVFSGTTIEPFDVEVVSILHNVMPKRDMILIRCLDDRFKLAKSVEGVSGSPVYFNGKLAGAMAYGWALTEEPLYLVTPIRQMLEIHLSDSDDKTSAAAAPSTHLRFQRSAYENLMKPQLLSQQDIRFLVHASSLATSTEASPQSSDTLLNSLPLSISLGGFDPGAIQMMNRLLPNMDLSCHLIASAAPAAGSQQHLENTHDNPPFSPGSTLTIPLISGDMTGCILGTVTEVIGNRVYGFGHPWQNQGPAVWPLAQGVVHTFINRITMSFKLGSSTDIIGSIRSDESTGVYGEIGSPPVMTSLHYEINWPYLDTHRTFDVRIARNEKLDPTLATLSTINALSAQAQLPQDHTIHYQIEMDFDGIDPIQFDDVSSGVELAHIFESVMGSLGLILNNPWQKVDLDHMSVKATISNNDSLCILKSAQIAQQIYQPGQTVRIQLVFEPLRDEERTIDISLDLPKDLPNGRYTIYAGSSSMYRAQLLKAQPYRFQANNAQDIQRILQKRFSLKRNCVYVCMALRDRGLAIDDQPFPDLPPGKALLLNNPTRKTQSSTFTTLIRNTVDTDCVIEGAEQFSITVQKEWP